MYPKWQAIVNGKKSNANNSSKLKPITTYHIRFVMKLLWNAILNVDGLNFVSSFITCYLNKIIEPNSFSKN